MTERPVYELVFVNTETKQVVFAITNVTRIFTINAAGIRFEVAGKNQSQFSTFNDNETLEVRHL